MKRRLNICSTVCITIIGFATLFWATDGWRNWTAEAARRHDILRHDTYLPDITVQNQNNETLSLSELDSSTLVVDFIFTRCPTMCIAMGYQFNQLQQTLTHNFPELDIHFLSISFDHQHDGPEELSAYLKRFSAKTGNWSALKVINENELQNLLDRLGVLVLSEPNLGFVHNTAIYVIKDNKVSGIYDIDEQTQLINDLIEL